MRILLLLTTILVFSNGCRPSDNLNLKVVDDFDIDRYLGTWYEVARFPHRFEKDLQGVTATYSLRPDGKIDVVNKGYKGSPDGEESIANGVAKIPDPEKPAAIKVSFFLFFFADYLILELDQSDYQYALVSSSSNDFLWILSRTPDLNPEIYRQLTMAASARGFDVSKLEKVIHG